MKRLMVLTAILATALALTAVSGAGGNGWLAKANLHNGDLTGGGYCSSFNSEQSGNWGGEYGMGAVTAFPGDPDDAGHCTFTWASGKARRIELRVLDGLTDDSFTVLVENPGGNMVQVYSYTDQYSTETWVTHNIYSFPAGKGQGPYVHLMIVPTNVGWSGFDTWGQLAVDYVSLYEH